MLGAEQGLKPRQSGSQVCALNHYVLSFTNFKQSVTCHQEINLFQQTHKLPQYWLSLALRHQSIHLGFQNYPHAENINNLSKYSPIKPRYALSRCELLHKEKYKILLLCPRGNKTEPEGYSRFLKITTLCLLRSQYVSINSLLSS